MTTISEHLAAPGAQGEAVFELNTRRTNGLEVILWWVSGTLETYVEVNDNYEDSHFILAIPEGHNASDVFHHPFAYKAAAEREELRNINNKA